VAGKRRYNILLKEGGNSSRLKRKGGTKEEFPEKKGEKLLGRKKEGRGALLLLARRKRMFLWKNFFNLIGKSGKRRGKVGLERGGGKKHH